VNRPGTLAWFARHEFRLAWRDWLAMMTAGGRARMRTVAIALVIFAVVMHLIAYAMVSRYAGIVAHPDKTALVVVTGSALLSLSLMLSQAMESVTRAFYARADLDLLLSSPAPAERIFAVRIAIIALSVIAMAALLAGPFINVLVFTGGAHWLMAYGAVAAMGAAATGRGGLPHHGPVSPDRPAPDPARCTDRRGGDRRRLCHRPAARGHRLGGHDVALRGARLGADPRPRPGCRQSAVVAGACHAR
jgi:hypothetical protein